MTLPIGSAAPLVPVTPPQPARVGSAGGGEFLNALEGAIQSVESARSSATKGVERLLAGEGEDLHTAALAMQRAELSFELFMQMRNKVVQAYQEVMRMQV